MNPDIRIFYLFNNLAGQSHTVDGFIVFFSSYLQYFVIGLFLIFLWRANRYSLREKLRVLFIAALSAAISRFGVTELIRFFYHRPRPFLAYSVHQLIPENGYSFPSGHMTFLFAFAAAVYLYNKRWGLWLYAASALIGFARIAAGVHYPSDILGGALIGVISGYAVVKGVDAMMKKAS